MSPETYAEHTEIDAGHGRIETRICKQLLIDKKWLGNEYRWSGLTSIIKVTGQNDEKTTGKETEETRWYIT